MISFRRAAWRAMIRHAERAYPRECCGALVGTVNGETRTVHRAIRFENASACAGSSYAVRPQDLAEADRAAGSAGFQIVGIYHSHPDRTASFSREDAAGAVPWYSFVIISVRGGKFDAVKSFRARRGKRDNERDNLGTRDNDSLR